jgi:hypothetical protein
MNKFFFCLCKQLAWTIVKMLKPHGIKTSYLNISNTMDPLWESSAHNPASFTIEVPNSMRTNKIWKIVPHTMTVPRMFPNLPFPDNVLVWYQRQVVELPTATPNVYLRTLAPNWSATRTLVFDQKIWNVDGIIAQINSVTGPNEVWGFDPNTQTITVTKTPTDPPIAFGEFLDPGHVAPPVTYANMTYIAEGAGGHIFTLLGMEKQASVATALRLSPVFDQNDPNTFDNIIGTNIDSRNLYPLFARQAHSYTAWSADVFSAPLNNQPNLAGPVTVQLVITDLGDSSTVEAKSGTLQDIIATINLGDVPFGTFKSREVKDADGECIEYQQARNISRFAVRLTDMDNRTLTLPRNFPVNIRLQLTHIIG